MKKIMKLFVLVAAAAMTLASCQKNEISGPVTKEVHFTINAGIAETKTTITDNGDGTYTPSWRNEDKIGIFFTEPTEKVSKVEAEFSNTKEDGETASFEGTASVEGEGTFYAFYPSSAFNQHYGDGTIRLDLPASQKPTSTSFDPACDILVAQPCDYIADGETVVIDNLYFARLMSVLRVNLVGDYAKDQIVESFSVEVDVNANVDITGNAKVDYKNATISAWNNGNVNRNVVTATYTNEEYITIAGTNNAAYLVVAPVTIPSGTTLTFTIETENYDIVKTVTAPADMVMPAGNIAVINLTIAEENCTAKTEDTSDYSGEWLITGKEGETWYAAQKYVSGNYLSVTTLEFEGESILESDGLSDCYMHIEKVVGGDYDGMYTIKDAGGKYLSTSSSTSNNMKAVTDLDANSYWDIEANDDGETYSIIATKSSYTRNHMRFNYNNGTSSRVSCYASTTGQPYLKLFSKSLVKADTTPRITVEDTEYNVSADDETLEFSYTTKNIDGTPTVSVADGATMTNVEADAEAGIVTVIFDANAEEVEKTATLVLSYEGAESVSVTITQAAKDVSSEGGEESIIYSTEFNYAIKGTAYNSSTEIEGKDEAGTSWGIVYGNWNGSSCAQLRVYSAGNFGSIYMKFDVANATKVSYKAKVSNTALKLNTYYSVDSGATWTKVNDSKSLSTSLTDYEFTISETGEYSKVRIKFEAAGTKPSSGNYQLTIDDVVIYGFKNGSGETPADPVQLTMSEITCSAQTENSLTFNWTAVANATGYEVTCNNKTETVNDVTYTATGLTASTQYTISVKAVGDGTNYTTSEAKTQTGTTAAAQGGGDGDTSVAPTGSSLWSETWGTYTGAVASYTFIGTTVYDGDTAALSYEVDNSGDKIETTTAGSVTSNNLFFYKSAESNWTIKGIKLHGATGVILKYTINRTNIAVYYSVDGGSEIELCSSSSSGVNEKEIPNLSGETISFRFKKTGTSANCRIDDISLTVN